MPRAYLTNGRSFSDIFYDLFSNCRLHDSLICLMSQQNYPPSQQNYNETTRPVVLNTFRGGNYTNILVTPAILQSLTSIPSP